MEIDLIGAKAYNEGVNTIVQVSVAREDAQTLFPIVQRFNHACNWLSSIAFQERLFHWLPLQRRAYHELRARYGVSAAEATVIVRKVAFSEGGQI